MGTFSANILPTTTGLALGSPNQEWDIFGDTATINNLTLNGVETVTGSASELQGVPIDTAIPTINQVLTFNGTEWIPENTQLRGNPVAAGLPLLNQALIWDGLEWAPANQTGGGGGGATLGYVVTGFSATPVFTPSPVGSCTFDITLSGNVTSSTLTTAGLLAGSLIFFVVRQNGTGGFTFAFPALCKGSQPVATTASMITTSNFIWDGTNLLASAFPMSYL